MQLVVFLLKTKINNVRSFDWVGRPRPPCAFECQGVPTCATLVCQCPSAALQSRWQSGSRSTQLVFAVVKQTGCSLPIPFTFGVAFDGQAVHHMRQFFIREVEISCA